MEIREDEVKEAVRELVVSHLTSEPEYLTTVEHLYEELGWDDSEVDEAGYRVHDRVLEELQKVADSWKEVN